ncbi:MAG: Secretion system C-terminal sorting domain, partial [Bacteroidota bacterium]
LVDTASAPYNPNYGVVNNSSYFIDDVSVIESNSIIKADNDTIINKGDTITLGKSIEGMPVDWYDLQGNLLAASSTLKVHPITTTSYVVKMDLCGNVSYDTVTVNVSTGVEKLEFESGQLVVYPNPASNELICKCANMLINTIEVSDVLGRLYAIPPFERGLGGLELNILTLPNGIYFIKASDVKGNVMNGKFVKE